MYTNEWWEKKAMAGMAIGSGCTANRHFGSGLNSSSGGELKLYLDWKRNTLCVCVMTTYWLTYRFIPILLQQGSVR